jgi:Mrp family chromosome partitioning ATPase
VATDTGFVILVARARKLKVPRLEKLIEELRSSRVEVLGVVLNRTRRRTLPKQYYGSTPAASTSAPASPERVPAPAANADR